MQKETRSRMSRNKRKRRRRLNSIKTLVLSLFLFGFLIGGSRIIRIFTNSSGAALAINISGTLDSIGENSPSNQLFRKEIERIEEIKRKEEEERLLEEKRLEEERRLAEEKKRLEEEARRAEIEKNKNKKVAYLTFDDGPSVKVTPMVLDILKDYDIKATFFVLGNMAANNQEVLKRIYEEGHSIGHHSYSHNYSHIYKNTNNFIKEINLTNEIFKEVLGQDFKTKLLRFPGGSFESYKQKYIKEIEGLGYISYDWNALNGDAEGPKRTKSELVNRLKTSIRKEKEAIILMHDTDAKMTTVEALPEIIDYLLKEGYVFEKLEQ